MKQKLQRKTNQLMSSNLLIRIVIINLMVAKANPVGVFQIVCIV